MSSLLEDKTGGSPYPAIPQKSTMIPGLILGFIISAVLAFGYSHYSAPNNSSTADSVPSSIVENYNRCIAYGKTHQAGDSVDIAEYCADRTGYVAPGQQYWSGTSGVNWGIINFFLFFVTGVIAIALLVELYQTKVWAEGHIQFKQRVIEDREHKLYEALDKLEKLRKEKVR